jgi:ABC-2 type transport system permease protein
MSGYFSLVRLDAALLSRRRLPRWVAGAALYAVFLSTLFADVDDGEGYRAVAGSARLLAAMLVIFCSVLGAVSISGDAATGSLRAVMIRPVGRSAVVLAHATTTAAFTALLYMMCIATAWVVARFAFGFDDVTYSTSLGEFPIASLDSDSMDSLQLRMLALALPALIVPPLLALCVSTTTDDPATGVVLALVITAGPLIFGLITDARLEWLFTDQALHPINTLADLSRGIQVDQDLVLDSAYTVRATVQPLCWIVLCLLAGMALFRRREIAS